MKFLALIFISVFSQAFSQNQNTFFERQWGLVNNEQTFFDRLDNLNFVEIKGRKGFDISWVPPEEISNELKKEVIVAVIDSGIDTSHSEFEGILWKDPSCKVKEGRNCIGKNFLNPNSNIVDDTGHGTHVSGIIAANNNKKGIVGVLSQKIKIMPLKVLSKNVRGFTYGKRVVSDIFAEAIEFAIKNGASVINISAGFPKLVVVPRFLKSLELAQERNIPIVVAAGNNNKDIPPFPCNQDQVICVGAVDMRGEATSFTNFGNKVDILAPGESIVSTIPKMINSEVMRVSEYELKNGTSQASPFVAGVMAAIKSVYPNITLNEMKARVYQSSGNNFSSGKGKFFLNGMINMKKALREEVKNYAIPIRKFDDSILVDPSTKEIRVPLFVEKLVGSDDIELEVLSEGFSFLKNEKINEKIYKFSYLYKLDTLVKDHSFDIKFRLKMGNFSKIYKKRFLLYREIKSNEEVLKIKLNNEDPSNILKIGTSRTSYLRYVFSASNNLKNPEYFYIDGKGSSKEQLKIGILQVFKTRRPSLKKIKLRKGDDIRFVIKSDYNLDGLEDYLIVTKSESNEGRFFYLNYYDENLNPLYGKSFSRWKFEDNNKTILLGDNSGLFDFSRRNVQFSWMKYLDPKLGNMIVPVINRVGVIPSDDNSPYILDYSSPEKENRFYAITPSFEEKEVIANLKLVNNYKILNTIREKSLAKDYESVHFEGFLKESLFYKTTGLFSVGEGFERRYFLVDYFSLDNIKVEKIENINNMLLSTNLIFTVENGPQDLSVFFTLYNRYKGRAAYFSRKEGFTSLYVESAGWSDPLFGYVYGGYENNSYFSFLESRYWVHYFKGNSKESLKAPINRESSFPGVDFSENLEGVNTLILGEETPGVFVNSTLLYGDQLYTIIPFEESLIRPIEFTYQIPENCAYMMPAKFEGDSFHYLALSCQEGAKTTLKFISLKKEK